MEIQEINSEVSVNNASKKIKTLSEIVAISEGKCIFTKGVFDILHYGHLSLFQYINETKTKNNLMVVVGLTSDKIVKEKKGNKRPINPEKERLLQIALLPIIDYVFTHDELDYSKAISFLKPKIYIKGMDTVGKISDPFAVMEANPEFKLMQNNSMITIFCDDGSISTSKIIKRINEIR